MLQRVHQLMHPVVPNMLKIFVSDCAHWGNGPVQAAELAVRAGVEAGGGAALPGMILNTSKTTTYTDAESGQEHSVPAGRMECTMQVRLHPSTHVYSPLCCIHYRQRVNSSTVADSTGLY